MAGSIGESSTSQTLTYSEVAEEEKRQEKNEQPSSSDIIDNSNSKEEIDEIKKLRVKIGFYKRNNTNLKKKLDDVGLENKKLTMQIQVDQAVKSHLTDVICTLRKKCKK